MARFYGKASAKVDDKGRIVFPAAFRAALERSGESGTTLIIKKSVHGACLDLYSLDEWVKRSDRIAEGLDTELNPSHAAFWEKYNEDVYEIVLDGKLGRINIPEDLLKAAGIRKEVTFAGVGHKIELWDKERRESALLDDETFKRIAAELSSHQR